jgi:HK97 family phage major capsid protein
MELKDMTLADVEARLAEIDGLVKASENEEEIRSFTEEMKELEARKVELKDLEERKEAAKEIQEGKASVTTVEERKGEEKMKDIKEFRNSTEYVNAFAEFVKTGNADECRALLTTNVGEAGTIAVPDFVYDQIKTAWDRNEILQLVPREEVPGNLQVQFEISGTDAVVHDEGSGAVAEETLVLGIVTLIPKNIKKWISVSDEVMGLRGQAFLDYILRELNHKIMKKTADELVGKIAALPDTATATTPSAGVVASAPAVGTVAAAMGELSDDAANPIVIMNKKTWSAFKAAQYAAQYAVDPFEGLTVRYNNSLPAYADASEGQVYMIVGDLGYGALANFPNGFVPTYKVDELTQKKSDLVEILGKLFGVAEPVACKAFALVTKPAQI